MLIDGDFTTGCVGILSQMGLGYPDAKSKREP